MENKKIKIEYMKESNNRTMITSLDYKPGMVINSKKILNILLPTGEIIYNGKVVTSQTYQENHPENKVKMGGDDHYVIDSESGYPIEVRDFIHTFDELTVEEHSIKEYKQRVGKTLNTITKSIYICKSPSEMCVIAATDLPLIEAIGKRFVHERKIKLNDYKFILKESTPWEVYGKEKTQQEIETCAQHDKRYADILEKMQAKQAESVIELTHGGFVLADENHVLAKKIVK